MRASSERSRDPFLRTPLFSTTKTIANKKDLSITWPYRFTVFGPDCNGCLSTPQLDRHASSMRNPVYIENVIPTLIIISQCWSAHYKLESGLNKLISTINYCLFSTIQRGASTNRCIRFQHIQNIVQIFYSISLKRLPPLP